MGLLRFNKRPPFALREGVLAELWRAKLFGEQPSVHRLELAKKLNYDYVHDSSVFVCLDKCRQDGLVAEPVPDTFEIRKEGFFWLCDSLNRSERLDNLPKPGSILITRYTDERKKRAEAIHAGWLQEWMARRDKQAREIATQITNRLVASGP